MGPLVSSLLILWLPLHGVSGQLVEQSPSSLNLQEGANTTLNCTFTTSINNLQWYRHDPGKGPTILFQMFADGDEKQQGRLKAKLSTRKSYSSLSISATQPRDSAMYLCAVRDGDGFKLTFGSGTRLKVFPVIKDPEPALYQLRSPKSSDLSVCLFTDFDSNKSIKDANTNASDPTVLEMMTMESKSYGAVAWGDKSNMDCTKAFQQNMVNFTQVSGSTCKVKDVKQGFETDKDLNTMNMILIVVRITFLKAVGFNLLMTLRLWSN